MPPRDPFDPDHPPPHWVDEEGNFGGWMSEAEGAEVLRRAAEAARVMTEEAASDLTVDEDW
jgi:hypothetical protein